MDRSSHAAKPLDRGDIKSQTQSSHGHEEKIFKKFPFHKTRPIAKQKNEFGKLKLGTVTFSLKYCKMAKRCPE